MRIRRKQKLNLIDNYVAIYRLLYNCKFLLTKKSTCNTPSTMYIQRLCDQTLDLKTKYEKAFEILKMIDEPFLLLKKQLSECKNYTLKDEHVCTIREIQESLQIIEKDFVKIKLKIEPLV